MHKGIQAAKTAGATDRATAAAATLLKRAGLDPAQAQALGATHRDPGVQLLLRMEGIADALEAMIKSQDEAQADTEEPAPKKPAGSKAKKG